MDELEQLKAELQQTRLAYQMAMQINQFKTGFLARTAHEIRSPLSSLMGLHQLILADLCDSPEEEREFLAQAYQAAQKLIKIIDDIILVSKLEYGRIPLEKETVNLKDILEDLLPLVHLQAANKNLQLKIIELTQNIYISADAKRLLQSLAYLVDTAINWMQRGEIKIQSFLENQSGTIVIIINCETSIWQESQNLLQQSPPASKEELQAFSQQLEMSTGERYLLALNLIEAMGGQLTLTEANSDTTSTQLKIAFPLIHSSLQH